MLKELLKKALARAKEIRAAAEAAGREYTEAEAQELEQLATKCTDLQKQIAQAEEFDALEAQQTQLAGRQTAPMAIGGGAQPKAPAAQDTRGFNDLADFAASVHNAMTGQGIDNRLYAAGGDGMGTNGSNGEGFMVPPAFSGRIIELALQDDADLLGLVDSEPTSANQVEMIADESTPWSQQGIVAKWRGEKTQMESSEVSTENRDVKLHQLYAFTRVSDELMEDAPRLANRLAVKAPEAIQWKLNEAIRFGTGVGQMLGYMNSKALVTVAKETSQAAGTLLPENIAKMLARMIPSSVARAHWEINPELLPALMTMKIGDQTIWTPPATGFANAPGGFLLGRPIKFTEHAKAIGAVGDIQLIDPMGYYMARKASGMKFDTSMHLYFDTAEQALRWTFKAGGQPKLSKPVSPQNGTATKSHFVTLAARG